MDSANVDEGCVEKRDRNGPADCKVWPSLSDSSPVVNPLGFQEQFSAPHSYRWKITLHLAVKQEAECLSIYRTALAVKLCPVDKSRKSPTLGCSFESWSELFGK